MSVDEDTVKTGSPPAGSASPALQLSERAETGAAAAATPDLDSATCPIPNHSGPGWRSSSRSSEPSTRKNPLQHSKQQQQQTATSASGSSRLTKRRNTANSANFKHPHTWWGKRRRRANSESDSLLPTNFYLGGNINDPLNLNSLLDEEVSRALNAETPKSSPLPARSREPVEILIPRDITDPLNLNGDDASVRVAPTRGGGGGGRRRHRNRHHGGGGGGGGGATAAHVSLLEAGGGEGVSTALPPPPHDLGKDSGGPSGSDRDPGERCSVEEASAAAIGAGAAAAAVALPVSAKESATSWPPGGAGQHGSRRKRRRNSGKGEPPAAQAAGRWSGAGDKGRRTGPGGRHYQQQQPQQQQKKKFQFGNYNKYYGYRNPSNSEDPRVRLLRPEWFEGKDVLDLGCNSGHLTLYVAKRLRPARILGLDIDGGLIHAARKNIRHYLSEVQTQEARSATLCTKQEEYNGKKVEEGDHQDLDDSGPRSEEATHQQQDGHSKEPQLEDSHPPPGGHSASCSFPVSLRISRGPIAAPPLAETPATKAGDFPSNVSFIKANYVLDSDHLVLTQRPEYDVIMCLSVTKWVHLNWGDSGLVRLFKRVFKHLRPGGLFLLEPQPWESYVRRKKLTDNINKNYHSIRLKPDQFPSILTTEVGFTSFEYLGAPKCSMRGFQRPIYLFYK